MSFDNKRQKKRVVHDKNIKHKMKTTFFVLIVLSVAVAFAINAVLAKVNIPFKVVIGAVMFVVYTACITSFVARLFSFKFISQVDHMTNVAKAIANSKDLTQRVNISNHPDELSVRRCLEWYVKSN